MKGNVIVNKTFDFAVSIVRLCEWLRVARKEFVMSNQVLRSGTSIGANVEEAVGAVSRPDFINKLHIAYKEARETKYWIRLLIATNYLPPDETSRILRDNEEILRIIGSILISSKK